MKVSSIHSAASLPLGALTVISGTEYKSHGWDANSTVRHL